MKWIWLQITLYEIFLFLHFAGEETEVLGAWMISLRSSDSISSSHTPQYTTKPCYFLMLLQTNTPWYKKKKNYESMEKKEKKYKIQVKGSKKTLEITYPSFLFMVSENPHHRTVGTELTEPMTYPFGSQCSPLPHWWQAQTSGVSGRQAPVQTALLCRLSDRYHCRHSVGWWLDLFIGMQANIIHQGSEWERLIYSWVFSENWTT